MKLNSFEALAAALDQAGVRYLVAGGLAVNAHGYLRFTNDVDLVIQLDPGNIAAAFTALETLGYKPIVPGMQVLQFWSEVHRETPIDVFVSEPFPFDEEHARALVKQLGSVQVRFTSLPTLIRMKEAVGRQQDRIDVEHLRMRLEDGKR